MGFSSSCTSPPATRFFCLLKSREARKGGGKNLKKKRVEVESVRNTARTEGRCILCYRYRPGVSAGSVLSFSLPFSTSLREVKCAGEENCKERTQGTVVSGTVPVPGKRSDRQGVERKCLISSYANSFRQPTRISWFCALVITCALSKCSLRLYFVLLWLRVGF